MKSDMAAVMLYFPANGPRDYAAVFGRYYLPDETIERAENQHYQGWERAGLLQSTDGPVIDFNAILEDIVAMAGIYDVREFVYDPWKNVSLVNDMKARGITPPILELHQTEANMSPAMVELEALALSRKIRHNGDPILDWMMHNVVAHRSPTKDTLTPRKESENQKIDGVTALLMCINRAMKQPPMPDFAGRGLFVIGPE
jgi:phage terminase large subunit-like protein